MIVVLMSSPTTEAIAFWCIAENWALIFPGYHVPDGIALAELVYGHFAAALSVAALIFLALRVSGNWPRRGRFEQVAWLSAFPLFVLFGANDFRAAFFAQNPQRGIEAAAWLIFYAMYVLVGTILIVALVRSRGASRVRLRWVIAALLCFVVQIPIQAGLDAVGLSGQLSYVVGSLFTTAGFAILAYAIVRHALFDIAFIINRAAIYAVLTGVVVAVFAALNWSVGTALRNTGLGIPVEVAFAGALGLTLNVVYRRLDRLVERVFFRRRFEAQSRLSRVARALANVTEDRLIGEALVDEPYEAFDLAGAAFYRRGDADGVYLAAACRGWAEHAVPSGAHRNGSILDPQEADAIERVGTAAVRAELKSALGSKA